MKTCYKCKTEKPRAEFSKNKSRKDGLQTQCKECERENGREYRQQNRERRLGKQREWREQNREHIHEYGREWRQNNPEKVQTYSATRRVRKRGNLTETDIQQSAEYRKMLEGTPCHYCGTTEGIFEIDHKQPVSRGGDDHWTNLVNSCFDCNRSKSSKTYEEFMGRPDLSHYCVQS